MFRSLRRQLSNPSDGVLLCTLVLVSTCLFLASESAWYGDSTTYAADIGAARLIEPGHLLWRPLGRLIGLALGLQTYSAVLWQLQFLCLLASILAAIAMYRLARRLYGRAAALVATVLLVVSNGFWTYSFSGCSYSLSMLFLMLALNCAIARNGAATGATAFAAGVWGGLAAATWGIDVLVAPAIWLALVLTPARGQNSMRPHVRNTACLVAGYVLAFVVPILLAYSIETRAHAATSGVAAWLASSRHGIPAHYSVAQLLRVLIGWPQSIISNSDLGAHLRLWRLREGSFPASAWLGVFFIFYAALAGAIWVLSRSLVRLDSRDRGIVVACAAAVGINLLFAASWQGTDLERYFPSWPFQLLLVALVVKLLSTLGHPRSVVAGAGAALVGIAALNWYGTLAHVLAPDSYRQVWLRELRGATSADDLVILFGQRTQGILSPHERNLPRIDNVSLQVELRGDAWRAAILHNITATRQHGGRLFLADTLFGLDSAPRDGWSFREYPRPTPSELQDFFLPFKSDRVGFVVGAEKVWLGKD
jgi:hypothetical protein